MILAYLDKTDDNEVFAIEPHSHRKTPGGSQKIA